MKAIKALVCLILFFSAGIAGATTFYVIEDGGTWYYRAAPNWPTTSVYDGTAAYGNAILYTLDQNNDTIVLSGGPVGSSKTYTDFDSTATNGLGAQNGAFTLRGCDSRDADWMQHGGRVILDGTSLTDDTFCLNAADVTLENMEIKGPSADGAMNSALWVRDPGTGAVLNDILIQAGEEYGLRIYNAGVTLNRCVVRDINSSDAAYGLNAQMQSLTSEDMIFNHCVFDHNWNNLVSKLYGNDVYFNGCLFSRMLYHALTLTGSCPAGETVHINDCIFAGNCVRDTSWAFQIGNQGNHQISISNSVISLAGFGGNSPYYVPEYVTETGIIDEDPLLDGAWPVFLVVGVDDYSNLDAAQVVADLANERGYPISYNLSHTETITTGDWTTIQGLVAGGNEIVGHGRHHWYNVDDALPAFTMSYDGTIDSITLTTTYSAASPSTGTATLTVNVSGGTGSDISSLDLLGSGRETISDAVSYLNSLTGYTVATAPSQEVALIICLADTSATSPTEPYTFSYDSANIFHEEMYMCKADIEANLADYECESFAYPGNASTPTGRSAMKSWYLGARSNNSEGEGRLNAYDSCDVFRLSGFDVETYLADGDDLAANLEAAVVMAKYQGYPLIYYGHGLTQTSGERWNAIFAAIDTVMANHSEIHFITLGEAIENVRGLHTDCFMGRSSSADDMVFTRPLPRRYYTVGKKSPAIGTGTNSLWAGIPNIKTANGILITDGDGNFISKHGDVEIGPTTHYPAVMGSAR